MITITFERQDESQQTGTIYIDEFTTMIEKNNLQTPLGELYVFEDNRQYTVGVDSFVKLLTEKAKSEQFYPIDNVELQQALERKVNEVFPPTPTSIWQPLLIALKTLYGTCPYYRNAELEIKIIALLIKSMTNCIASNDDIDDFFDALIELEIVIRSNGDAIEKSVMEKFADAWYELAAKINHNSPQRRAEYWTFYARSILCGGGNWGDFDTDAPNNNPTAIFLAYMQRFGMVLDHYQQPTVAQLKRVKSMLSDVRIAQWEKFNANESVVQLDHQEGLLRTLETRLPSELFESMKKNFLESLFALYLSVSSEPAWMALMMCGLSNNESKKLFKSREFKAAPVSSHYAALQYSLQSNVNDEILKVFFKSLKTQQKTALREKIESDNFDVFHSLDSPTKFSQLMFFLYEGEINTRKKLAAIGFPRITTAILEAMKPLTKAKIQLLCDGKSPAQISAIKHQAESLLFKDFREQPKPALFDRSLENLYQIFSELFTADDYSRLINLHIPLLTVQLFAIHHRCIENPPKEIPSEQIQNYITGKLTKLLTLLNFTSDRSSEICVEKILPIFKVNGFQLVELFARFARLNHVLYTKNTTLYDAIKFMNKSKLNDLYSESLIVTDYLMILFGNVIVDHGLRGEILTAFAQKPMAATVFAALISIKQSPDDLIALWHLLDEKAKGIVRDYLDGYESPAYSTLFSGLNNIAKTVPQNAIVLINNVLQLQPEQLEIAMNQYAKKELFAVFLASRYSSPILSLMFNDKKQIQIAEIYNGLSDNAKSHFKSALAANVYSVIKEFIGNNPIDTDEKIMWLIKNVFTDPNDHKVLFDLDRKFALAIIQVNDCEFIKNNIKQMSEQEVAEIVKFAYQPNLNVEFMVNLLTLKLDDKKIQNAISTVLTDPQIMELACELKKNGKRDCLQKLADGSGFIDFERVRVILQHFHKSRASKNFGHYYDLVSLKNELFDRQNRYVITAIEYQVRLRIEARPTEKSLKQAGHNKGIFASGLGWFSSSARADGKEFNDTTRRDIENLIQSYVEHIVAYNDSEGIPELREQPFMKYIEDFIPPNGGETAREKIAKGLMPKTGSFC